jgi:hypothetical protein
VTTQELVGKKALRERLWLAQNGECAYCRQYFINPERLTIDHIIPKWMDGSNDEDNLQLICQACHDAKNRIELEVRLELLGFPKRPPKGPATTPKTTTRKRTFKEKAYAPGKSWNPPIPYATCLKNCGCKARCGGL